MKPHPSQVFQAWKSQMTLLANNPGGPGEYPLHIVHFEGHDKDGRLRVFDIAVHGDVPTYDAVTFGETRVDNTEPANATTGMDCGIYQHFNFRNASTLNSTLDDAVAKFVAAEELTNMSKVKETHTVKELQLYQIELVERILGLTTN